jgi:uncharacterized protein (DUF2141 family)
MFKIAFKIQRTILVAVVVALSVWACARRGMPSGGPKDETPPKVMMSVPENFSINFKEKEFKVFFDEYVTLKELEKQLIISPPLKNKPDILPMAGTAKKFITVKLNDTLSPNTTYSFMFGKSIVDATEGNAYENLKYVFSTGTYVDSLSISGKIKNALEKKITGKISVFLYAIDSVYTDSAVYKQKPRYIISTTDTIHSFSLENLKEGAYRAVAVEDKNENYKFDPNRERIGFLNDTVKLPSENNLFFKLFKEKKPFKTVKASQASGNQLLLGYEGKWNNSEVFVLIDSTKIPVIITHYPNKDSVQLWHKPLAADSLIISIKNKTYKNTHIVRLKEKPQDSLKLSSTITGTLHYRDTLRVEATTPILNFNANKIKLLDTDSIAIPFTVKHNSIKRQLVFNFEKTPSTKYQLIIEKEAVEDWFNVKNKKEIVFSFETKPLSDYGNLVIQVQNAKRFPAILELVTQKGETAATAYLKSNETIDFLSLQTGLYDVRLIYDDNENGEWDTGNFLENKQPEEVLYLPKSIDVRMNWDINQVFDASAY